MLGKKGNGISATLEIAKNYKRNKDCEWRKMEQRKLNYGMKGSEKGKEACLLKNIEPI